MGSLGEVGPNLMPAAKQDPSERCRWALDTNSVSESSASQSVNDVEAASVTTSSRCHWRRTTGVNSRTAYERANDALEEDDSWAKEIVLGKRAGFYRIRGELGIGNFSQVKIAVHHLTKEKVAMKTQDKTKLDEKTRQMLSREISVMERLCHPHVVQLFEVLETLSKVHLVMEYAGGGDLCAKVTGQGKLEESRCMSIFAQLVSAVDYMHSVNVIHRDIKSENVFFAASDEDFIKVGDFGFSTVVPDVESHLRTFCGSPPYAAPELFRDESYVGTAVDIWALGVLLYFAVTGVMPFRAQNVLGLKKLILDGDYHVPTHVSTDCRQLLDGILRKNPQERYTVAQVIDSSWLRNGQKFLHARKQWVSSSGGKVSKSPYYPWPQVLQQNRNKLETETRRQMSVLGITELMINENLTKGCRSPVMGTFRILIHSLHARERNDSESSCETIPDETDDGRSIADGETKEVTCRKANKTNKKVTHHKNSKLCYVL